MGCFDAIADALGQTISIYTPAWTVSDTKGVEDPSYTLSSSISAIVEEMAASDEMILAGGPILTHSATLSVPWDHRGKLATGNLVKDENNRIWKMTGVPVLYRNPLGHAEMTLEYLPNPPEGLV